MAVSSERKRRNSYSSTRRSGSEAETPSRKANARRKNGDSKKSGDTKKGSKRRKRSGFSFRISLRGIWRALRWAFLLALVALIIFGAGIGMLKAYRFCTTSDSFSITDIKVSGNAQVKTGEILGICGLEKGSNGFAVNIHDAEQELLKNPWIESATIRRELPGSFIITIKERVPLFCARKKGKLYYVTAEGLLIAPVDSRNFRSLPILEIGPGGDDYLPQLPEFIAQFRHAGFPFTLSQISWLRISAGAGFELYWESRKMRLGIGAEQWKDNMKRIASVVSDLEKRKELVMVSSIRAADGQVWMTKKTQQ
jgi:cell division protein FtsQ